VGVVIYYLDKNLINQSYLVDIRRINGTYTGKNITKAVIPILIEMGILLKLGYFITNNDARNNVYIRVILRKYRPNIKDPDNHRVRYLRYIINLIVKAFLFGKNTDVFKNNINTIYKNSYLEVLRAE
jgi:hypothetical protein